MKILLVNKFLYPNGGSERYLFDLAEILRAKGHQVEFFGMDDPRNIVETPKEKLVKNIDFHKNSLSTLLYPFKIIYSSEARHKIRRIIREFRPDLVHLNNYNFQITPSIIYELKKHKIPVVQTLHDPVLVCPSHLLYNVRTGSICEKCKGRKYRNCMLTQCIHGSLFRSVLGMFEGYLYYKLKTYDYIEKFICPSQFLADKLIDFGVRKEKLTVIPNFIHSMHYSDRPRERNYFLYFGRISREKGMVTLVSAVKALPGIQFVFAGSGPLENMLQGIDNGRWVGFKQGEELRDLIRGSIATIYPSEWYENSPLSILESFGLGVPVIGSNIGGIPELIKDQFNGLLFEPQNIADLVDKIKYLDERKELRDEYARNCLESSKSFSREKYYQSIFSLYRKVV